MKKLLVMLLKVAISAAIIGYLVYDAVHGKGRGNVFANLVDESKNWNLLFGAWAACTLATIITFVRWWLLVRSQGVPCPLRDAIRISFWGYLFNLAPLGIVGGDVVKAVMLDHEHPQHRSKAIASVLVDRIIGLYVLFIVASVAILATGFLDIPEADNHGIFYSTLGIEIADVHAICWVMFGLTIVSTLGLAVVMGPDLTGGRLLDMLGRIPRVGPFLKSVIEAVRMYSHKPAVLIISCAMSVVVHCLFAFGVFLIASGLPGNHLTMSDHFVVMPVSAATQVIPLPIGPFEAVLDYLYTHVPVSGVAIAAGQGLVVALVYRLITLLIAAMGVICYFGNRREMAEVMHEAEHEQAASHS